MDRKDFDPDGVGVDNGNYFGFPFTEEDARLVLLSVPWDVTASYGGGAAFGPDAIIEASTQLDFYDPMSPGAWKKGVATVPTPCRTAAPACGPMRRKSWRVCRRAALRSRIT